MEQEHERAAGAWHAEWLPLTDLLRTTGSAAAWLRTCLESLEVDVDRMRTNLLASAAELVAEPVAAALTPALGRAAAHDAVAAAVRRARTDRSPLRDVLLADPQLGAALPAADLDALLDLSRHVGDAPALVDAAVAALARRTS